MHLVTGGSGYFGEILVRNLLAKGFKVRIFDLHPPDGLSSTEVEVILGDIRDIQAVERACGRNSCLSQCCTSSLSKE